MSTEVPKPPPSNIPIPSGIPDGPNTSTPQPENPEPETPEEDNSGDEYKE